MASPFEHIKKGALHQQMHVPRDEKISCADLQAIKNAEIGDEVSTRYGEVHVTPKMKKRATFAHTFGGCNRR